MQSTKLRTIGRMVGNWLPVVLLALIFVRAGLDKFSDTSGWAIAFRHWGYPDWFRMLVGVAEIGGVVLLMTGRAAAFGAMVIVTVMLGAICTHVLKDHGQHMTSEIVPLFLATLVLILRRDQLRTFAKRP